MTDCGTAEQRSCVECLALEQRLRTANDRYIRLILAHERMLGDFGVEAVMLVRAEKKMVAACSQRNAVAGAFLVHRLTHLARAKMMAADQSSAVG